jgi:hypothetical protein
MKKLLLITIILLIQSFPSFGNPNGKGILCVLEDKELNEQFPKEHKNLLKFGFSFNNNKVTLSFVYKKNDDFLIGSGKPIGFNTSSDKIEWGNTYERWELDRKSLKLKEIGKTKLKDEHQCEVYSQKIYLEKIEEMRKTLQNLNSIKLKDNKI